MKYVCSVCGYTYDETTGVFSTADGVITVPGAVYTQVTDIEEEINGLYTYDRKICKVHPAEQDSAE